MEIALHREDGGLAPAGEPTQVCPKCMDRILGRERDEPRFNPELDPGIREAVIALKDAGVETFESCQGGEGHSYVEPTVRFHGDRGEGMRALGVAISSGLPVQDLRLVWPVIDGNPTGPYWEMTFSRGKDDE